MKLNLYPIIIVHPLILSVSPQSAWTEAHFYGFQLGHSRQHTVAANCHAFYYIAASDRKVVESNVPENGDKIPPKSS